MPVFLWFVAAIEASVPLTLFVAPELAVAGRVPAAVVWAMACACALGAAAAAAASLERLAPRRRARLVPIAALPLVLLAGYAYGLGNAAGVAAFGVTLLGICGAFALLAGAIAEPWRLLPLCAGVLLATFGLMAAAQPAAASWPEAALLLVAGAGLLLAEWKRLPRASIASAAAGAVALEEPVRSFAASERWLSVSFLLLLVLFLVASIPKRPSLRLIPPTLLAVTTADTVIHLVTVPIRGSDLLDRVDLVGDTALAFLAAGWFLRLRPTPAGRWLASAAAAIAIAAGVTALQLGAGGTAGSMLKQALLGPEATALLVLAFAAALLAAPRLPRAAGGALLVTLGVTTLALILDRSLSFAAGATDTHDALALVGIALALTLEGVVRAHDGPIGGRIFAVLGGLVGIAVLRFAAAELALEELASLGGTGAPALARAETANDVSRKALLLADLLFAGVGGILLTATITRPLAVLVAVLRRSSAGPRSGLAQTDEIGTVARALDEMMDEADAHNAAQSALLARLRREEAELRSILDGSLSAFIGADAAGRITRFNPQAESLTGWRQDEVLGRIVTEVLVPPLMRRGFVTSAQSLAEAGGDWYGTRGRMPLLHRDGHVIQTEVSRTALRMPDGEVVQGAFVRDVSEQEHHEAELERLALYDTLTDLPNRTLLRDRCDLACVSAGRDGSLVGVAIIDLDRFKEVNDSLGHPAGDEVLREVARRLRSAVRPGDTVARLGGDEFGIVLGGLHVASEAEAVVSRCLAMLRKPVQIGTHSLYVTASAGLSVGPPPAAAYEECLRRADVSMYEVKRRGGNGVAAYAAESDPNSADTMRLVADLHRALEGDELALAYQPIIDLPSGACDQVEALARWQHPDRGSIPPIEIIDVAERWGLIRPLGYWVLEHALDDLGRWRAAGHAFGVSVNVSAHQLGDPAFVGTLRESLRARGLPDSALTLEITESAFVDRRPGIIDDLRELRSAGIRISIDDFGTGYSTLASLAELPVDEVKIDRSFVAGVTADAAKHEIVKAAAALVTTLGLAFVAEGVEDEATWDLLASLGRAHAQGFAIGRPLHAAAVADWVTAHRVRTAERAAAARAAAVARSLRAAKRLEDVARSRLPLEDLLTNLWHELEGVVPYDRIGVALLEDDGRVLRARWAKASYGTALRIAHGYSAPMAGSSLQEILRTGKPRIIGDLIAYLAQKPDSMSTRLMVDEGIRSSLTCPLAVGDRAVGFMFFSSRTPRAYDDVHASAFEGLAELVAGGIARQIAR